MATRGDGRIFRRLKLGRKVWMLDYWAPRNGKLIRVRESAKTEDEEVALKRLARRSAAARAARAAGDSFETPQVRRRTVGELLDALERHWKLEKEIRGLDQATYRVRVLREHFGHRKAQEITTDEMRRFVEARRGRGLANASINRETEILGKAFRLALDNGEILRAPKFPARLPERNVRQGFFEQSDVDALLPHLPPPLDDVVRLGFRCGWRRGELLGLRWDAVSRDEVRLAGRETKNGAPRSLPIDGPEMKALFAGLRKAREYETPNGPALSAYVFHRGGQPINRTVFGKQWRRACIAAGLGRREGPKGKGPYVGKLFHDLRRSAVRAMVRGGVPQSVAMAISGHKTDSMFKRYDIVSQEDKRLALELSRRWTESEASRESNVTEFSRR